MDGVDNESRISRLESERSPLFTGILDNQMIFQIWIGFAYPS